MVFSASVLFSATRYAARSRFREKTAFLSGLLAGRFCPGQGRNRIITLLKDRLPVPHPSFRAPVQKQPGAASRSRVSPGNFSSARSLIPHIVLLAYPSGVQGNACMGMPDAAGRTPGAASPCIQRKEIFRLFFW